MITEALTAGSANAGTAVSACSALSGKVRFSDGSRTPRAAGLLRVDHKIGVFAIPALAPRLSRPVVGPRMRLLH